LAGPAAAQASSYGEIGLPQGCLQGADESGDGQMAPLSASNIRFREMAADAGVDFQHIRSDSLFNLGGGAAAGDYNGDGLLDIYATNSAGSNALYRNNGNGTFTDVAVDAGVADSTGWGNAAGWGDYDNDGDLDLFVANYGTSKLFKNEADGTFIDVTDEAGVGDPDGEHRSMGVAWGDYDRDGNSDLLVVRHVSEADPEVFNTRQFATAVRPLALYHNDGDGAFTNVTRLLGDTTRYPSSVKGAGFKPTFVDYDNDGDQDIYIVNDFGRENHPNVLWRNDGADIGGEWLFTDVSKASGTDLATFGMGLAVGDHDNDGDFDFFITDCGDSDFIDNRGDGTFVEVTQMTGTARGSITENSPIDLSFGWGAAFVDVDNDGLLDLYYVAGQMDTDPGLNRAYQPNALFHNQGGGTFVDISAASGANDPSGGRDVIPGDFDNDGLLDLFVVNMGTLDGKPGVAMLYLNESKSTNHWLSIRLVGTTSNRDALGARISVTAGGQTQIREMGVSQGHNSHSVTPVYFGLGEATEAEIVKVIWPSGEVQTISEVPVDQLLTLTEPPTATFDIGFTTTCFPAILEDGKCWIVPPSVTIDQGFTAVCDGVINPFTGACTADCSPLTIGCTSGNFVNRCFGQESGGVCYSLIPGPPISAEGHPGSSPYTTCLGKESVGTCYSR
ncbi:MAG: CRTAC1 family protein, partial [Chloroflexi bacterium]|nr:CRTAC1 family protein [Chloroflexota bacterium]